MKNEQFSGIWIFAEHENGAVKPVVFELLAKAQELKAHNGENITAVLLGANVAGRRTRRLPSIPQDPTSRLSASLRRSTSPRSCSTEQRSLAVTSHPGS